MNARHMTNARRVASARASFDLSARRSRARRRNGPRHAPNVFAKMDDARFEANRDVISIAVRRIAAVSARQLPSACRARVAMKRASAFLAARASSDGSMNAARKHSRRRFASCVFRNVKAEALTRAAFATFRHAQTTNRVFSHALAASCDAATPRRHRARRASASHVFHARSTTARDSRHSRDASRHASNAWSANRNARSRSSRATNNDCFVRTSRVTNLQAANTRRARLRRKKTFAVSTTRVAATRRVVFAFAISRQRLSDARAFFVRVDAARASASEARS